MSRGKKIGMILMVAASLYMTACSSSIPQMTEEQNNQVVEYAAGLLLRHDANNPNKLVEVPEETAVEETIAEETKVQKEPTPAEGIKNQSKEEVTEDKSIGIVGNQYDSMEEFYEIEGITVNYTGYELKDTYPETGEEDLFFAMQASTGSRLLVLKFQVSNTGTNDQTLNMMSLGSKFKVSVDGKTPRYALTTMLSDDLASYTGTIPAGASEQLVLVSEIAEEDTNTIQTLSLIMKKGSEDGTLVLAE